MINLALPCGTCAAYGEVFKGTWRQTQVAIKRIHANSLTQKEVTAFMAEADLMMMLKSHDNVVSLRGLCAEPLALVMEFLPGGSLYSFLHSSALIEPRQQHRIALGIARGMLHLVRTCARERDSTVSWSSSPYLS